MVLGMENKILNMYHIAFEYDVHEGSDVELPANNAEHAKDEALNYIKDVYSDVTNVTIKEISEVV